MTNSGFRRYMVSVMRDEKKGPAESFLKAVLSLFSCLYGLGVKAVDIGYRSGVRKVRKARIPVISVGNLTLGGTGKTPFAAHLADTLLSEGRKPAILIRGYGDDEHVMLKDELPDVPVYVGQDRVKSAETAARDGCDVIILDDGFQHRRLKRDLDILLLDSRSPFGNGFLFPRGILREPPAALKRADMIVLTRSDALGREDRIAREKEVSAIAGGIPLILAEHRPTFLTDVTGAAYPAGHLSGKKVCLLCGIADPDSFAGMVKALGAEVSLEFFFGDHHVYSQKDIDQAAGKFCAAGADMIISTAKDYVKLKALDISSLEEKLFILNIRTEITDGKEKLLAGLDSVYRD